MSTTASEAESQDVPPVRNSVWFAILCYLFIGSFLAFLVSGTFGLLVLFARSLSLEQLLTFEGLALATFPLLAPLGALLMLPISYPAATILGLPAAVLAPVVHFGVLRLRKSAYRPIIMALVMGSYSPAILHFTSGGSSTRTLLDIVSIALGAGVTSAFLFWVITKDRALAKDNSSA